MYRMIVASKARATWRRIDEGELEAASDMAHDGMHFRFGLPKPLLEPLAVERLYLDNYFSIAKAQRDLGYQPMYTTKQALEHCLPYYVDLFHQMKSETGEPLVAAAAPVPPAG